MKRGTFFCDVNVIDDDKTGCLYLSPKIHCFFYYVQIFQSENNQYGTTYLAKPPTCVKFIALYVYV